MRRWVGFEFNKLVFARRLNNVMKRLGASGQNGIRNPGGVEPDRFPGIVVAWDDVIDLLRGVIGIDHPDQRDTELARLGHCNLVVTDINHKNRIGQTGHIFDPADTLGELFMFALRQKSFLLGQALKTAVGNHRVHVLEAFDRRLDRLEVAEHATEPAGINVGHTATTSFFRNDFACLTLGADKKNGATVGRQATDVLDRLLVHDDGLFEVDDVDSISMAEDVGGHLGVPEPGLMSKVDTRFQHIAHGVLHDEIPYVIWVGTHAPTKSPGKHLPEAHRVIRRMVVQQALPREHPVIPVRALRRLGQCQGNGFAERRLTLRLLAFHCEAYNSNVFRPRHATHW